MSSNENIAMVDLYFDGELEKGKEAFMFTMLSQDYEAREYFKKINIIKSSLNSIVEDFPAELDKKILLSVKNIGEKDKFFFHGKKYLTAAVYAASIIFLLLTIFFYSKSEEYKVQFADLTREVKKQNEKLELLMNALPPVDVYGSYYRTKQITVRPNS